MYKGTTIRLLADLSAETLQDKRQKGKKLQPRILYTARLSYRVEGEIRVSQTSKA